MMKLFNGIYDIVIIDYGAHLFCPDKTILTTKLKTTSAKR